MGDGSIARIVVMNDARVLEELARHPTALNRDSCELVVPDAGDDLARCARQLGADIVVLGESEACLDAIETVRRVAAVTNDGLPPRIVFIGRPFEEARARDAGAHEVLIRPIVAAELKAAIGRLLAWRERGASRLPLDAPVVFETGGESLRGRCLDLSLSGAFVEFGRSPQVGALGTLEVRLPHGLLAIRAEIVRAGRGAHSASGHGLRFLDVSPATRVQLARIVHQEPISSLGHLGSCES